MTRNEDSVAAYDMPVGTYEEALALIGTQRETRFGEVPANWAMIKSFCAILEDGNPSYWDPQEAERLWGSIVAPPAMLHAWVMPLPWRPEGADRDLHIGVTIPLPGTSVINTSIDVTYERSVRVGDVISRVDTLVNVSPQKTTRIGVGHFLTTSTVYRNQEWETVAKYLNTLFRFTPAVEA